MVTHFAFVRVNVNHVTHVQVRNVHFDRQGARIFHGVEEDWRNFAAEAQAAAALVRHVRNVVAHEPQHGVGCGLTGRTGTHNVTHIGQREPFFLQGFDLFDRADAARLIRLNTFTGVFQHRQSVQRAIRARPRVRCRREVIGVGFTGHFKDGNGDFFSQRWAVQEPFGISPGLHHLLRIDVACFGFFFYVVEVIEHQQRGRERFSGNRCQLVVIQRVNQRMNVVTTLHGAEQFNGFFRSNQWGGGFAFGDSSKESGFYVGSFIYARRYAVDQQI